MIKKNIEIESYDRFDIVVVFNLLHSAKYFGYIDDALQHDVDFAETFDGVDRQTLHDSLDRAIDCLSDILDQID